jgi:hypothetical protein
VGELGTDVDLEADLDDEPLRWYVVAAFMLAVVGGFALAVWLTAGWFGDCDRTSREKAHVADDSLRATLCESGHGAAGLLVPGGWVLGLVLATIALLRWGGSRLRALVLAVLLLTPVALPAAAYAGLGRSSTGCTEDKLEKFEAWVDAGSRGAPPYDCRTF